MYKSTILLILAVLGCVTFGTINCAPSDDQQQYQATVHIDTTAAIGETDDAYICVTLDYFTFIPEAQLSILSLDLTNPLIINAVKAFSPLRLRVGGTLEDVLVYETPGQQQPCINFVPNATQIFGWNQGCLPLSRWDQLNEFFKETGAAVVFGLNALYGKHILPNGTTVNPWDSSNAESLIRYTVSKGYNNIFGWELGNELSGNGVGASIPADQYANDTFTLANIVQEVYNGSQIKPIVLAPGGFFNAPSWFTEYFKQTTKSPPVITHHVYCLGPGEDTHLIKRVFDPDVLDECAQVYKDLQGMLKDTGNPAVTWVGESGGAWHGGHHLVTNSFASGFWYLDQLAMAASYNTKTFCRQTLIGGHYGLLNTTTFAPNPDYYTSLLWHRLMGTKVLATKVDWIKKLRAYTLCSRQSDGVTMLILNLDPKTFEVTAFTNDGPVSGPLNQSKPQNGGNSAREEYHLTALDGDIRSQTMLLNGQVIALTPSGDIPQFIPQSVDSGQPIIVGPYSIVFVHFPAISSPACKA